MRSTYLSPASWWLERRHRGSLAEPAIDRKIDAARVGDIAKRRAHRALASPASVPYPVLAPIRRRKAMPVTMYHNPRCNTSRRTLALLRQRGVEPTIIEYLKTPYTAAQLKQLLGQLKMPASKLVRKKEAAAAGIDPAALSEDALIAAMAENPIIVERPIVVSGRKAALGRPPEAALSVL
jgi:arsenate reductase (glutaredoxin)